MLILLFVHISSSSRKIFQLYNYVVDREHLMNITYKNLHSKQNIKPKVKTDFRGSPYMSWNPLQVLVKNRSLQIFFYKQFPFFSNSNFLFYTFLQQKKNEKENIFKSRYILSKCQCYKNKQSWQIEYLLSFSNKILTFSETRFQPGVDLSKWKIYNMKRCYQKKFWQP